MYEEKMRKVVLVATLVSGSTGLIFQLVWQRYLSYIVGSESRSISLVIAVFLLGLATGYLVWGKVTERIASRSSLLKYYGFIELGIGVWAIIFPNLFSAMQSLSYALGDGVFSDLFITVALIFVPTCLMGGDCPHAHCLSSCNE